MANIFSKISNFAPSKQGILEDLLVAILIPDGCKYVKPFKIIVYATIQSELLSTLKTQQRR